MSGSICKIGLISAILAVSSLIHAADAKKDQKVEVATYQGINIGVELGKPLLSLLGSDQGFSLKADVNLKNTWFPTVEIGRSAYVRTAENGTHCQASGAYLKLGANKSLIYLGDHAEKMFYAGAHYGFSAFKYTLNDLSWYDNYWGPNNLTDIVGQQAVVGWLELTVGVRVQVYGPISLGWSGQYKSTLHVSGGPTSDPAYIPGYGENLKPMAGLAVHFYYKLPF